MTSLDVLLLLESVWCLSVGLGIWNNDYPKPDDATLPLLSFDYLLRWIGPFLPFLVFASRALIEKWLSPRPSIKPKLWDCFALYMHFTLIRIGLYALHLSFEWFLLQIGVSMDHLLSDHIVLAASIVAILELEIPFLLEGLNERNPLPFITTRKKSLDEALAFVLLLSVLLMALTFFAAVCGDMFYTALYFHPRIQSFIALCIGLVFQVSAGLWLRRTRTF